jgi:hypothetical protein
VGALAHLFPILMIEIFMRQVARYKKVGRRRRFNKPESQYMYSVLGSIIRIILGLLMSTPFIWFVIFSNPGMSLAKMLAIIGIMVGLPLLIIGIMGFVGRKHFRSGAHLEVDVSRIRFATEFQLMRDIFKGDKK